jgi:hypothetical protein
VGGFDRIAKRRPAEDEFVAIRFYEVCKIRTPGGKLFDLERSYLEASGAQEIGESFPIEFFAAPRCLRFAYHPGNDTTSTRRRSNGGLFVLFDYLHRYDKLASIIIRSVVVHC